MSKRSLFSITVLIVVSLLLSACGATPTPTPAPTDTPVPTEEPTKEATEEPTAEATEEATEEPAATKKAAEPKDPDTFVALDIGEPESLDPAWTYETGGGAVEQNIYEGLVAFNREKAEEFVPALAESWDVSDGGLTWTFNIRDGVKFHEGGTLEPHDIAYSIQRGMLQDRIDGPQWLVLEPFFGVSTIMDLVEEVGEPVATEEATEEPAATEEATEELAATEEATEELTATEEVTEEPAATEEATEEPAATEEATEEPAVTEEATEEPGPTAEAVEAACKRVKEAVSADDDAGTVTLKLNSPAPWLPQILAQQWGAALDMEWMAENGDWDGDCATWPKWHDPAAEESLLFNKANGTGPYKLDGWTPGEEIVLVANEDYWRTEPMWEGGPSGAPTIKRVVIKLVEEWGTRFAMLEAGDADYSYVPQAFISQADTLVKTSWDEGSTDGPSTELNADGVLQKFDKLLLPAMTVGMFNFNINTEGGNPFIGTGELDGNGIPVDFFSDIHVRKAFNYAFDWDAMIGEALQGNGIQPRGPIINDMMGWSEDQPMFEYDPAKAEEEFKQAWDGEVWDKGFYMQVVYNTGNDPRRIGAEIFKQGVESLNDKFNVVVYNLPWPTFLDARRSGKLPIPISGWLEDYHDPSNWVHPFMHPTAGAYARVQSFPEDLSAKILELISAGVATTDDAKRKPVYEELQSMAYDNVIDVFMYQPTEPRYFQEWAEGYYYNPLAPEPYHWVYALSK